MNKTVIALFLAAAALVAAYKTGMIPPKSAVSLDRSFDFKPSSIEAPDGYELGFEPATDRPMQVSCYMVKYRQENYALALKYAETFMLPDSVEQSDDSFIFYSDSGVLTANREGTWFAFDANLTTQEGLTPLRGDEDAILKAESYVTEKYLMLFYEDALVHFDGETYRIEFINRIGDIKNYAFRTEVSMDKYGRLERLEYCSALYEKVGSCQVKPISQALLELPNVEPEDSVLLRSCQLVYIYDDSIVQPAYFFLGDASEGRTFECFVKAALF
ncbi:MAG: hypothetical protein LBT59_01145 [Clostridiales bacterium]|jgi:hypothetical protein|nr:hypothetical protein [Clostridiales bacterium]